MTGQGMVVLASEQVWPVLSGLMHAVERKGVTQLHVIHTDDERKSKRPAENIRSFCEKNQNRFKTVFPVYLHQISDTRTESVSEKLNDIFKNHGTVNSWLINATGGTKLMFLGAVSSVNDPAVSVVYREIDGTWFQIEYSGKELLTKPFQVPAANLDTFPLESLIELQASGAASNVFSIEPAKRYPLLQILQNGPDTGWNWKEMFSKAGFEMNKIGSLLFEEFVAGCILKLGVSQVCTNLTLRDSGQALQEVDVIALYRERIYIFDLKLETEQSGTKIPFITQIGQADEVRRTLGGLGAKCILVRPGMNIPENQKNLAKKLGLEIWDRKVCRAFFQNLSALFGMEPPDIFLKCSELLEQYFQSDGAVFANLQPYIKKGYPDEKERKLFAGPILDVNAIAGEWRKHRHLPYSFLRQGSECNLWVDASIPDEFRQRLTQIKQKYEDRLNIKDYGKSKNLHFKITGHSKNITEFSANLKLFAEDIKKLFQNWPED